MAKSIIDWKLFHEKMQQAFREQKAECILAGKSYTHDHVARECDMSTTVVWKALNGEPIGIEGFLRLCVWLSMDPNDFIVPDIARSIIDHNIGIKQCN